MPPGLFRSDVPPAQFLQKSLKIALRALPSKDNICQSEGLVLQGPGVIQADDEDDLMMNHISVYPEGLL